MTDGTPDKSERIPPRKGRGIRSLAGEIGLGLVVVLYATAIIYIVYRSRSESWDLDGIRALEPKTAAVDLSVGLEPHAAPVKTGQDVAASAPDTAPAALASHARTRQDITSDIQQSQDAGGGVAGTVTVDLQNTTGEDITLLQSVIVMESEEGSHVLHSSRFALDHDYFMPAGHTVSVTLMADDPCAPENTPETCVESYFNGMDEIVLFDKPARYEVHIPLKAIRLMRIEPKHPAQTRAKAPTASNVVPSVTQ